jgi:hypothetical protein
MGFYYDHFDERWLPIDHDRRITAELRHTLARRGELIEGCLDEIRNGRDAVAALYAGLLARTLTASDQLLMRKYGQQVTEIAAARKTEPDGYRTAAAR